MIQHTAIPPVATGVAQARDSGGLDQVNAAEMVRSA